MNIFEQVQCSILEREGVESLHPGDLHKLQQPLRRVMLWVVRSDPVNAQGLAQEFNQTETEAEITLEKLIQLGYLKRINHHQPYQYSAAFGQRRTRAVTVDIWDALKRAIE